MVFSFVVFFSQKKSVGYSLFLQKNCQKIESGHHLENNLVKFGYILDMKVGKKIK
jgi:hypothetical protein